MSSFRILFTIGINLFDVIAYVLLRSIKQFHNLLYVQPHIFALESYINDTGLRGFEESRNHEALLYFQRQGYIIYSG